MNTTLNNYFSVSSKVFAFHEQDVEERGGKGVPLNCLSIYIAMQQIFVKCDHTCITNKVLWLITAKCGN